MRSREKESIANFNYMWDNWGHLTEDTLELGLRKMSKTCKGFGTGGKEIWKDREAFKRYCQATFQEKTESFEVERKWIRSECISETVIGLWGELKVKIVTPVKEIEIETIRTTAIFKDIEGEMKLQQWHMSIPDASMEEEMWGGTGAPKLYEEVTILFTDFEGFTELVSQISPRKLVDELNEIFSNFDKIVKANGLEKIKTIGDAYMASIGLRGEKDHAYQAVQASKKMLKYLEMRNETNEIKWQMRIGLHSGEVVGGTIGSDKLGFDLWGDTVNIANRIESAGKINKINISKETHELIKESFDFEYRGQIEVKGKGRIEMYFVE